MCLHARSAPVAARTHDNLHAEFARARACHSLYSCACVNGEKVIILSKAVR
eukprot:NODE_30236_length_424_cov_1.050505.p3 GENE.NODE_30236_length_424_cov_1.050505~~NODE_30236_length_424_cov_1.050505.p3  ORF type:complete len:51 (+),score=3.51 NODE_30236_length_424_cov_1.050505:68-220(+)